MNILVIQFNKFFYYQSTILLETAAKKPSIWKPISVALHSASPIVVGINAKLT